MRKLPPALHCDLPPPFRADGCGGIVQLGGRFLPGSGRLAADDARFWNGAIAMPVPLFITRARLLYSS